MKVLAGVVSWFAATIFGGFVGVYIMLWVIVTVSPRSTSAEMAPMGGLDAIIGTLFTWAIYLLSVILIIFVVYLNNQIAFLRIKHVHRFWFLALVCIAIAAITIPACIYAI